ncbi:hypothetical protein AJ78_06455 [Emergomyces pasteurianus Ep9510]|uniref:NACHT-NTPase and P-loop NTPases N-terminal domain-containing protein n=1 Tax=Emergomyces pasteurianus Ep9510 TaxID=1447872 RepID=A0A1J9P964_9EURO|nr:hypothetical protein AJ78_06455 [Emergomyces pasteurianus Ep9510]
MAEALAAVGAASSIVQLLDFTVRVTSRLYCFLSDSIDSPESIRAIKLELPFFVEALQQTKSHLDLEHYGPSAITAIQCLVDECTSLMAILEAMLEKSVPQTDDSKLARSRKAVYGVTHEKVILAINAKLSEFTKKLLLYQGATSPYLLETRVKSIERLLENRAPLEPLAMATSSAKNETQLSLMGDARIVRRQNSATNSCQYRVSSGINLSRLGIPWIIQMSLNLSWGRGRYNLCPSLQAQRLVKRTSPAFEVFWKCDNYFMELSDGLVELRRLFQDGWASPFDADPDGKTWLEILLDFRGAGDAKVRREFLEVLNEWNVQMSASIPVQSICYPLYTTALPNPEGLRPLNANLLIEENRDAAIVLDILLQDNPNRPKWGGYDRSDDPLFLKFVQKCSKHINGLWNHTSLMDAILCGTVADIASCIERKVPLDSRNSFGQTAMHLAVLRPSELLRLIKAGAKVDIKDDTGATPLCYAICYGCTESMILLLEVGANPFSTDELESQVSTCLQFACCKEDCEVIRKFFSYIQKPKRFPEKILNDVADSYVANWLETLGSDDRFLSPTSLNVLLESGISPNVTSKSGVTLLHCVAGGREVQDLFRAGFLKVDQLDDQGRSPLMKAFHPYYQEPDTKYKAILAQGVDVNLQTSHGISAMHNVCGKLGSLYALSRDNLSNLKALSIKFERAAICLSHGADALAHDNCKCLCSVNGCSPTTFLLPRLLENHWWGHIFALEWLLMLKEYRSVNVVEAALTDLVRSIQFSLLGMTHTCEIHRSGDNQRRPRFQQNQIDEILDRENDLIQQLEESMLSYEQRPDRSIEASWVYILSSLQLPNQRTPSEIWNFGTWQRSPMQTLASQTTTLWGSPDELVNHWARELRGAQSSYCFVDKSSDEYRLAMPFPSSTIKPSELYSMWVEYVFEHKEEFEFPKPLDAEWLKTRRYWAAQQANALEAAARSEKNDLFKILDEANLT